MKVIRCECGCIYPDDMDTCPTCKLPTKNINNRILSETSDFGTHPVKPFVWKPEYNSTICSYSQKSSHGNDGVPGNKLVNCKACNKQISTQAESCPHCGHPTGVHICPKCGSANTKTISGASKATSIFLWGPFAANKVLSKFQCKNCGHKF